MVVDSVEEAVMTALRGAGATAVLSYGDATTAQVLTMIAHVVETP